MRKLHSNLGCFTPGPVIAVTGTVAARTIGFRSEESKRRSLANLRPWNRETAPKNGGRPRRDHVLLATLNRELNKRFKADAERRTFLTLVCQSVLKQAVKGNMEAARLLFDRILGRCPTAEELAGAIPTAIVVNINRNQPRKFGDEQAIDGKFTVMKGNA